MPIVQEFGRLSKMLSKIMEIPSRLCCLQSKEAGQSTHRLCCVYTYKAKLMRSLTDLVGKGRVHCECVTSPGIYTPHHCGQWREARLGQSLHQGLTSLPPACVCTHPKLLLHNLV